ncbi:hypothetical protein H4R33_002007 [Dimargaris cristalligena]|uniref:5-formyltetrahydrofolate cyclo-ligase n=1 Tax=Dimargaris cristalligena TaxID=215637 RepID=A0A4Q0A078_9FUNG|nr:hypothetical protein H4R33_002007 [Dimargaris cristalligena]RKP38500.1 5-formyltetrahydrofolate cyclo-ligase-like protein [Dimargaris cristalligena]|eukprot:RKP38500.1 5-formyltetrahydrofolate cyclo-ligase-like protein [Dimargaris cristalligena]
MSTPAASLSAAKKQLRQELRKKLATIGPSAIEAQSVVVTRQVLALPQYSQARRVCVYLHMSKEVTTNGIVEAIFRDDKQCFVPRCTPSTMDMVRIRNMEDFLRLPKNNWGIPEPPLSENRTDVFDLGGPDLIIMPGLAFDQKKTRLGHGKGYYDKYLKKCREFAAQRNQPPPALVALALQEQILDEDLPHNELDEKPDVLVTPDHVW